MKPTWLNKKINLSYCRKLKIILKGLNINTVCREANCPNISECFPKGIVTFMILGDTCTRDCKFCGIKKGKPPNVDLTEPSRVTEAALLLRLKYVVITSPTRDDLKDKGAGVFHRTIKKLKSIHPPRKVEVLIPDFQLDKKAIERVVEAQPDVVAHNIETVPSLYREVLPQAHYAWSLELLRIVKTMEKRILTKSGIMLGLGEKDSQVIKVLKDLRKVGCDFLSIGQYLAPSLSHWPVKNYVSNDKFNYFKNIALSLGFLHVLSAPYVRSSYLAHIYLSSFQNFRGKD